MGSPKNTLIVCSDSWKMKSVQISRRHLAQNSLFFSVHSAMCRNSAVPTCDRRTRSSSHSRQSGEWEIYQPFDRIRTPTGPNLYARRRGSGDRMVDSASPATQSLAALRRQLGCPQLISASCRRAGQSKKGCTTFASGCDGWRRFQEAWWLAKPGCGRKRSAGTRARSARSFRPRTWLLLRIHDRPKICLDPYRWSGSEPQRTQPSHRNTKNRSKLDELSLRNCRNRIIKGRPSWSRL